MATPTVVAKQGFAKPADANVPVDTDPTQALRILVTVRGTSANVLADYATLAATNFASPSATLTWERAD